MSSKHINNKSPFHYVKSMKWLGHEMDDWRAVARLPAGELHFAILQNFHIGSASTHSSFQLTRETLSSGPAVDHSPQSSLRFKNVCRHTSFPPYTFMVWPFINLYEPCGLYIGRAHRYPPNTPFYIIFQQIYVLNFLNMLHTLRFFLFKMPFIS